MGGNKNIDKYSDRISLKKCREILRADELAYSDEDVLLIRDFLYPLAQVDFEINQKWFNEGKFPNINNSST